MSLLLPVPEETATSSHAMPALSLRHSGEGWSERIDYTGHLVTRASFNSGKLAIVAISDPFIGLSYSMF